MTFIVADRVQETTNSPGTGTATLLGAVSGYQSFSTGIGANNTTFYVIADQLGTNWEVGLGALNSTGTVLTRTTVYSSSNGGSTVNFATGTQYVWCDFPASKAVIQGTAVNFSSIGATTAGTGAFTTLSASSTVSGAGFSNYFAAPPTIGNTTPNAGTFTDLTYTGTLTGGTGVVNLGSGQFYKDASGNVGIGTSSPARNLSIYGTNATIAVQNSTTGATSSDGMLIQQSGNDAYLWNLENSFFSFGTNNAERMRITSGGSVLIGQTTAPSSGTGLTTNGVQYNYSTSGGGLIQTPNGTGLSFYTYTGAMGSETYTERMRIDSSGNVGIGGSPASEWASSTLLQLNTASTYSTFSLASTRTPIDNGRIGSIAWDLPNNTSTYKTRAIIEGLCSGSTANKFGGSIVFSTASDNTQNPTERMRLNSTGALVLAGGTTTATGVGITFPATQSASSDANTLDDYEEGTFTFSGASPAGYTISAQSGYYTKIGNVVNIFGKVTFSAVPASNSQVVMAGLPFTNNGNTSTSGACRENSTTGSIYMLNVAVGSTTVELNSMDGISAGSQRTIRTGESYLITIAYFVG